MKSIRNVFVRSEEREKRSYVGHAFNTEKSYTRADFLSPGQVAAKFDLTLDDAKKIMQKMKKYGQYFVLNDHRCPIIVKLTKTSGLYMHPMAQDAFKQYLEKQRN